MDFFLPYYHTAIQVEKIGLLYNLLISITIPSYILSYTHFLHMATAIFGPITIDIKGGSRRLKKSHEVWMMMMMIAARLMWAGAAEKPEHSKMT